MKKIWFLPMSASPVCGGFGDALTAWLQAPTAPVRWLKEENHE
jgi:hypothetical protein